MKIKSLFLIKYEQWHLRLGPVGMASLDDKWRRVGFKIKIKKPPSIPELCLRLGSCF